MMTKERNGKAESRLRNGTYVGYRVSLKLIREGRGRYAAKAICSPEELYEFFKPLSSLDREVFYCVHLDSRNQILSCEQASMGCLSSTIVHPREIYKTAILSSAANIAVAHNHPSGDPTPSLQDHEVVKRLRDVGTLLGIALLDSIIVGDRSYYSAKTAGEL
jgi:DNA repair protein RadC